MMNKYTNLKDPYTYDGSDVLINKFGIRDAHKLEKAERDASFRRVMELWETPIQGNFDLKHLQAIHRTLFSDVYPFAGEIRTIDISKGNSRFAHAPMIEGYLSGEFRKLKSQNYLQGTTIDQFSEKAANVMGEINAAHPFREGNGRATREFIGQLARRNGFEIHWSNISDSEMINASIQSFNGDNRQLELLIRNNISIEASKVNSNELEALAGNKSDKETAYDQFAVEHANTTFRLYQFSDLADTYANNNGSINLNEAQALVDSIYYDLDQLHDKEGAQHVRVHFEKELQDSGLSNVLKLPSPEKDNQQDLTL